jgi:hypothetical protein
MAIVATTNFSLPIIGLADLVASAPTLHDVLGVATPTLAHAKVFHPYAVDREDALTGEITDSRPRVIINPASFYKRTKTGTCFGATQGGLFLAFEFLPSLELEGDAALELAEFMEAVGNILQEMEDRAGQDKDTGEAVLTSDQFTHLNVVEFELLEGPIDCPPEEENGRRFYAAMFGVSYIG